MRRRSLAALVSFTLLTVSLAVAVPAAAFAAVPAGWWSACVMSGNGATTFTDPPKASAALVAAIARTDDARQVWVWRPGNAVGAPIVTAPGINAIDFAVGDSRIAWLQNVDGGLQVMTWKLGDAKPTTLTAGTNVRADLAVSVDRVVWVDNTAQRICTWKLGVSGVTTLPTAPYGNTPYNPSVSGDRIVYEMSTGDHYQIISWKDGEGDPVALEPDEFQQIEPAVSGDRVAWCRYFGGYDSWVRTKVIGGSEAVTVGPLAWGPNLYLSGDRIAWRQWSGDPAGGSGVTHLATWKSGDTTPTRVTHEGEYVYGNGHETPVSGERLAWLNWRGVQGVMTWLAGDATPTILATGTALGYPALGGSTVAWLNTATGSKGIYVAHPQALPKLTTPVTSPAKPTHAKYFTLKGGIGSGDPVGTKVSLRVERYYSRKWHFVTTYTATLSSGKTAYSYTKAKLSKAGKYRVRASHSADYAHRSGTSSWRTFTVK